MTGLSERKAAIVRTLFETAPDGVVGGLRKALADIGDDGLLTTVRDLVESEARDRHLRDIIFAPIAPLCAAPAQPGVELSFPPTALASLWRGLKRLAPDEIQSAKADLTQEEPAEPSTALCDAFVRLMVEQLRLGRMPEVRTAAEACEAARAGAAGELAACLDLGAIVRRSIPRLPEWLTHAGDETHAAVHLAYKDAVEIAPDAGPRFFEMLAAQLPQPWRVLRLISAVMDKPTEHFLASSEFRGFPERLLADIDDALHRLRRLEADAGPDAARAAGRLVDTISRQTHEFDACIILNRDTGWGHRVLEQKRALAALVESVLDDAETLVTAAMPTRTLGSSRQRRTLPKLDVAPDPVAITRAMTLLTFAHEVHTRAPYAGFSAAQAKFEERLGAQLDQYVDEALDLMRAADGVDMDAAHAILLTCADFCQLVRDGRSADLIRRRAAASTHGHPAETPGEPVI